MVRKIQQYSDQGKLEILTFCLQQSSCCELDTEFSKVIQHLSFIRSPKCLTSQIYRFSGKHDISAWSSKTTSVFSTAFSPASKDSQPQLLPVQLSSDNNLQLFLCASRRGYVLHFGPSALSISFCHITQHLKVPAVEISHLFIEWLSLVPRSPQFLFIHSAVQDSVFSAYFFNFTAL